MQVAPLNLEIAEAPSHGVAYRIHTEDGVQLRVGAWQNDNTRHGTIFVFPGRTEYIEKYGRMISVLDGFGFCVFVVDWRGQGLAERLLDDPRSGHVNSFSDYQMDVAAMVNAAEQLHLPKPWNLVGHSMGACIGLRALSEGLAMEACAFTGPLWNINMPSLKRVAGWPVSWAAQALGQGHLYAPGTDGQCYVLKTNFPDNRLTHDADMYQYFINQATKLTDQQIGGPSLGWLFETLMETRKLSRISSPKIPCIAFCGDQDEVVDLSAARDRMRRWSEGKLEIVKDSKHDVFSEIPCIRSRVLREMCVFFGCVKAEDCEEQAVVTTS